MRGHSRPPAVRLLGALSVVAIVQLSAGSAPEVRAPVEVVIPVPPSPVPGTDGRVHLAYELHVTNFWKSTGTLRLERVEAFGEENREPLVSHGGSDLDGRVLHPGEEPSARFGRSIAGGMRVLVHIWVTLEKGRGVPAYLRHRLVFVTPKDAEQSVDGARVDVRAAAPFLMGPPLRGGVWFAHNGPGNHRAAHWGSVLALNGGVRIPQRYALDFIGLDANGRAVRGNFRKSVNEDWAGFGADVLAVADGVVSGMRDGVPDNTPLVEPGPPATPTAADTYGNFVVLDLGSGRFVHYAHLQRDSVVVKLGERVRRGQRLGRLGNSGNTNAAHLHFNFTDAAAPEYSEGRPFVFDSFELLGETTAERAIAEEHAEAKTTFSPDTRRRELPLNGAVVRFPR
jgi:hypothetical protein